MEIPKTGRASINNLYDGVEIIIPARKNWFLILIFSFWIFMWTIGIIVMIATTSNFTNDSNAPPIFVVIFFLCFTGIPVFFIFRILLWNISGKEMITFSPGVLTLNKKNVIFFKAKAYYLADANNFRVQEDPITAMMPFGIMRAGNLWRLSNTGTIRFDYGMETKKFGAGIDEAEATYILQRLRDKKLIS